MSTRAPAPFGTWATPLTPDVIASTSGRISHPTVLPDRSIVWLEGRSREAGRQVVVRLMPGQTEAQDLIAAPFSARSFVHEYGGLPFVFHDNVLLFSDARTGQLMRVDPQATPEPLGAPALGLRVADLIVDAQRSRLLAIGERHPQGAVNASAPPSVVENSIVSIELESGAITPLLSGHDFYAAPALSPDGRFLAFLAWDHPHMPWDAAALYLCELAPDGTPKTPRKLAGGAKGSALQPTWSAAGELYVALESMSAPWNIHRVTELHSENPELECVFSSPLEWGAPLWILGTTLWAFVGPNQIVGAPMQQGQSQLVLVDLASGSTEVLSREFPTIGQLSAHGNDVVFTLGWAGSGSKLLHLDLATRKFTTLRDSLAPLLETSPAVISERDLSPPEPLSFATRDGDSCHGFFYAPKNSRVSGTTTELPPLMVLVHGGPTASAIATLQLSVQQFTTRGFAVLDVNYRGSSGFGRAYREKLRGGWGVVDVDDCVEGALALAAAGRVDRKRLLIRGGSAGGFTVLMALAKHPKVFAAATCNYGISDPRALSADTHKFESHYDRFLFGEGEALERAFDERSPLKLVDEIETPVIFFQGLEDKAVPPQQTEGLYHALKARGVTTEYHGYAGEQHGFRKAETLRDVFEKEWAFYARVLG